MNQTNVTTTSHSLNYWLTLTLVILSISGIAIFIEQDTLSPGMELKELLSYKLTGYANVLLAASCAVYILHLWRTGRAIGSWATGLATAGTMGLWIAICSRWYETYQVLEEGHVPISNLYEVTVFFTALIVTVYLVMESTYRNRAPGAFVMPIVLGTVALQEWLVNSGQANPGELVPALQSYWMHAHVLANFIGYGAFAVACGAGIMFLVRHYAQQKNWQSPAINAFPPLEMIDDLIYRSVAIGLPTFTLAVILGAGWAYFAWGSYWSWDPKETWSLIVVLVYAAFLHARYLRGWSGVRMAWWAIAGFLVTLFCFLGVNLFLSGLHSYGNIN